jgi:hypothetical protein
VALWWVSGVWCLSCFASLLVVLGELLGWWCWFTLRVVVGGVGIACDVNGRFGGDGFLAVGMVGSWVLLRHDLFSFLNRSIAKYFGAGLFPEIIRKIIAKTVQNLFASVSARRTKTPTTCLALTSHMARSPKTPQCATPISPLPALPRAAKPNKQAVFVAIHSQYSLATVAYVETNCLLSIEIEITHSLFVCLVGRQAGR